MAKNTTMAAAAVQAEGDALVALLSNGYLEIYSGTQPATADTAIGAQVLLATLRFGTPAAGSTPSSGVITFNAIASGVAGNTGTAAWFRCLKSDGTTGVMDGTADVTGNSPNLVLGSTSIVSGATISVASMTHTLNKTTSGY
jgi:hypothetical protein